MYQQELFLEEETETLTGNEFTRETLEEAINTGKNTVFSYPAGSGKTTAICDYIVDQVKSGKLNRKIIYVAPTKSLLDAMYERLVKAGLPVQNIFNYHSSSEDYKACFKHKTQIEGILYKISISSIILITHERMKFDAPEKFIDCFDKRRKPLIFLDESIEDCNIAGLSSITLQNLLFRCGLIDIEETHHDFLLKKHDALTTEKAIFGYLTKPRECIPGSDKKNMCHLKALGIELADRTGFDESADMNDVTVYERFKNLYVLLSMAIAEGNWLEVNTTCYIRLPVAIHESWKDYAQIIVADATAFINACICKDFDLKICSDWNTGKLHNFVAHSKNYTRTKLEKEPEQIVDFLDKLNLKKYNKIYLVTFKGKMLNKVLSYLKKNYSDYRIETVDYGETKQFLQTDVDSSTDELFTDSDKIQKIIYVSNFGKTRGSNKFRECDCVVQIGDYRLNPDMLNCLNVIYPGITSDKLALTNFIQELYRGRIRLDQDMDSYALVDDSFYKYFINELDSLGFKFTELTETAKNFDKYGMNSKLVEFLYEAKANGTVLHKRDLLEVCGVKNWKMLVNRLKNLYSKYEDLRQDLFIKYPTLDAFSSVIVAKNKGQKSEIELIL